MGGEMTTLVLWDIDGTLLDGHGEGKRAFYATLDRLFPGKTFSDIPMAGRTDFGIWHELAREAGTSDLPAFSVFGDLYAKVLEEFLAAHPPRLLAGAGELLATVDAHPGFHNGLVTGNFYQGTRVKLQALGVWELFVLDGSPVGGYGDHVPDKGPLAREALDAWATRFPGRQAKAVVVGDTPEDVRCAKVAGIGCLGVATGGYSVQALLDSGAEAVVRDLSDTAHLMELLERIAA